MANSLQESIRNERIFFATIGIIGYALTILCPSIMASHYGLDGQTITLLVFAGAVLGYFGFGCVAMFCLLNPEGYESAEWYEAKGKIGICLIIGIIVLITMGNIVLFVATRS